MNLSPVNNGVVQTNDQTTSGNQDVSSCPPSPFTEPLVSSYCIDTNYATLPMKSVGNNKPVPGNSN